MSDQEDVYAAEDRAFAGARLLHTAGAYYPPDPSAVQVASWCETVARRPRIAHYFEKVKRFDVSRRVPRLSRWESRPRDVDSGTLGTARLKRDGTALLRLRAPVLRVTVIHELAHIAAWRNGESHGPQWRAAYVDLVRDLVGDDHANRLSAEFSDLDTREKAGQP